MTSWSEFAALAPELVDAVATRFVEHRHALVATLRRDGFPRISGIEAHFFDDDLWLGMMPDSVKGADLRRDPRFSLHSAPTDLELVDGDAKVQGRAVLVDDAGTIAAFVASLPEPVQDAARADDDEDPPGPMDLFRVDVVDVSLVRVDMEAQELVIDSWRAGEQAPLERRRK